MNLHRRTLLQTGTLVLLLGRAQLARGASILGVRVWPANDYTRVTIESDTALVTRYTMVGQPPRLAVDIEGIELNAELRELVGKVRSDDPFITGVRIGQFTPTTVRLVMDLRQPVKPQVFNLEPVQAAQASFQHRLVLDLYPLNAMDPLEALIEIVDNEKNVVIASFPSNSKTGKYLVTLPSGKNYGIVVKKEGYLFHSENFDIPLGSGYQEITKDVELKNIAVGSKIVLKNIFFDFDKATLRKESFNELENLTKLLNDVPSLKIEISGHTDGKGSAAYNLTLSDNRAKAVVDYLVGKGISKDRLVAKGYGLTRPIATNDTEEGRQLNRRTEFEILSK